MYLWKERITNTMIMQLLCQRMEILLATYVGALQVNHPAFIQVELRMFTPRPLNEAGFYSVQYNRTCSVYTRQRHCSVTVKCRRLDRTSLTLGTAEGSFFSLCQKCQQHFSLL